MAAISIAGSILGWLVLALALAGCGYTLAAAVTVPRFFARVRPAERRSEAVTLLKPLHGDEPRLADNLATLLAQEHDGPVQLLCGVQRGDDPVIAAVEAVRRRFPAARIDLVVDGTRHGASGKVSNLVNMSRHIAHPIVVLSDRPLRCGAASGVARDLASLSDISVKRSSRSVVDAFTLAPVSSRSSGTYLVLQLGQMRRTSRCARIRLSALDTLNGSSPMSRRRVTVSGAELVCRVLITR